MTSVRVEARHGESVLSAVVEYPTAEAAQAGWDQLKAASNDLFMAAFDKVPLSIELTLLGVEEPPEHDCDEDGETPCSICGYVSGMYDRPEEPMFPAPQMDHGLRHGIDRG